MKTMQHMVGTREGEISKEQCPGGNISTLVLVYCISVAGNNRSMSCGHTMTPSVNTPPAAAAAAAGVITIGVCLRVR